MTAFSFRFEAFLTRLILPVLLEKQSLLLGLLLSISRFFLATGEPPLDCGLKTLLLYLLRSVG